MTERILLVDYENIQAVDLGALPDDVKVGFVLGGSRGSCHLPCRSGAVHGESVRLRAHLERRA